MTSQINQSKKKISRNKAFTLVEILVALAVFNLIVGAVLTIFVSAISAQRKTLASQELLDQTSYVLEYLSRTIRMAKKDLAGACLTTVGANYQTNLEENRIRFLNYQDKCQEFFLDGNQIMENKSQDNTAAGFANPLYLTSPKLKIISFKIGPSESWDQEDNLQPRLILFLGAKGAGQKPEQQPEIKIQTTISQRNLDIRQ